MNTGMPYIMQHCTVYSDTCVKKKKAAIPQQLLLKHMTLQNKIKELHIQLQ